MQLVRLRLEHWRAVDAQEVRFDPGVTLIEGPNEVGKTSLIEGLNLLFRELDSSRKADVRAVQPAGQDIGSSVEAELRTGPYHFTYRKTFNRRPATTLDLHAPRREQLTGREAHERAWALLNETVDTGLWQALQVEQGAAIAQASLKDSRGLARALDAAAGTQGADDGSALYERARAEYGRYFTERAGRARFGDLELKVTQLKETLEQTRVALTRTEADVARDAALAQELVRLEQAQPALERALAEAESAYDAVTALRAELELAQIRLEHAELAAGAAEERWRQRRDLIARIEDEHASLAAASKELAPLERQAEDARAEAESVATRLQAAEISARSLAAAAARAETDLEQVQHLADLARLQATRERLASIHADKADAARRLADLNIDGPTLERMQAAHAAYREACARLEAATPAVEIGARAAFDLVVDGRPRHLSPGERYAADASEQTALEIGGLAIVTIRPAGDVVDLRREVESRRAALAALFERHGVADIAAAAARLRSRQDAAAALERAAARERDLLQGVPVAELEMQITALCAQTERYEAQRRPASPLPGSLAEARTALTDGRDALVHAEQERERLLRNREAVVERTRQVETALELARQALVSKRDYVANLEREVTAARRDRTDAALAADVAENRRALEAAHRSHAACARELAQRSPEQVEALRENARLVLQRQRDTFQQTREERAAVRARLDQARSQGLFEQLGAQEAALESAESDLAQTRRRAAAAAMLWETLNRHRQSARRAYLGPLTERIERLGRIVFGAGFAIEMDEELTIVGRTLDGRTVSFDDLSVGAREQLGILARLAAAQLVSEEGGVPLILDDSLGYADPQRLRTMGAVIAEAGKSCQVIVLTCTPGRFMHVGNARVVRL